jgi:hypothetical protein
VELDAQEGGEEAMTPLRPQTKIEHKDFYEAMMLPDAPDEMAFQIDRARETPPDQTFSMEAVNELAEQFRLFLMARIYGESQKGVGPHHLRAYVNLDWKPGNPQHDPDVGPYFAIDKDEGITQIDGSLRKHSWKVP